LPDGSIHVVTKVRASKWESNLVTLQIDPDIIRINTRGNNVNLAVIPCIDCLYPEVLGALWRAHPAPNIVLCPSLSPVQDHFHNVASVIASKGVLFAFANSASFGGTFFNVPESWLPYLKGASHLEGPLPKGHEAVLALSTNPDAFFVTKGTIGNIN